MGFGGGGGGSTTSTVTQNADPWSGIQPYLQQAAGDIGNLYNNGQLNYQYYPNSTIAPQSGVTQQALQAQIDRAQSGSDLTRKAQGYTQGLLNGDYLNPNSNPYLKSYADQALDGVQGRVNSSFAQGGRSGGGINQQILSSELGKTANNIYGQAYDQERNRQQQGLLFAPTLANQDYYDIGQLASAGNTMDQRSQDLLNEDINRFNFNQQAPTNGIQNFVGLLNQTGGNYGTKSGTTTQPYYGGGGGANALGLLGSLGGGLGGLFGSGVASATGLPWLASAGLGSQLGGLASLVGFSDIRLKENILHVGYEKDIPIYHFNYKNDPDKVKWRGVMAQDIIGIIPDAIGMKNGYATVDYDMIGIKPERLN